MSETISNPSRRYLLIATAGLTAIGGVATAVPFVRAWEPSARARALGAPIRIDISKLQPGEQLGPMPAWRGQPIFVIRRTPEALDRLKNGDDSNLADPDSEVESQQPNYAVNAWRSIVPEIGVYLGLCTHLGCSPKYYGAVEPKFFPPEWQGGFFCPCHGSRFDLAGRVGRNLPAPNNLLVPPHSYESEKVIVIGVEEQTA